MLGIIVWSNTTIELINRQSVSHFLGSKFRIFVLILGEEDDPGVSFVAQLRIVPVFLIPPPCSYE